MSIVHVRWFRTVKRYAACSRLLEGRLAQSLVPGSRMSCHQRRRWLQKRARQ